MNADRTNADGIIEQLARQDYCHCAASQEWIAVEPEEENSFKAYWDNLAEDENFKNYTCRERRILRFFHQPGRPLQLNTDADYRSTVKYDIDYKPGPNHLQYAEEGFIHHPLLQRIVATDIAMMRPWMAADRQYAIDIHQFRVKAKKGSSSPTTSGIHQDGMAWICMHFIQSVDTQPVVSEIFTSAQETSPPLLATAMSRFLETLIVNDKKLYHRAGSVRPAATAESAYRDLLLVTFRPV
ncbi:2OG-Fe dioxygenase family protein [Dickeya solani]|uniref:2OG-Fe dioxygenase family protein n=1 Tax=Dickeya solani TaxID=1089444 RepID=A0AAX4F3A1_9GAMM|nr:2OG-Fe dioxygenase family protein [Dickeya solani]WOA53820.1 2OG-Fe dioxygenase family protein [Dickeya solani]